MGPDVQELQKMLSLIGYSMAPDGIFGKVTESVVKQFQLSQGLSADGIVGPNTWSAILVKASISPQQTLSKAFNPVVDKYIQMPDNEFIKEVTAKIGITYHHTVSDGNPEQVVRVWDADGRGAVGTHFIIGRKMNNGDMSHDGKIVQCVPIEYWLHHILTTRMGFSSSHNNLVNKSYIGIELCSYGCLKKVGNEFYALDGRTQVPTSEVTVLKTGFRTYEYWHSYTPAQIESLRKLTLAIATHYNMDLTKGIQQDFFELSWDAMALRRTVTTHTNFEYGKFDTFPQPELKAMISQITGKELLA